MKSGIKITIILKILPIIIYFLCLLKCSSNNFQNAFNEMKEYYMGEKVEQNFIIGFESVLKKDSLNENALSNSIYYLLSRDDSVSISKCYKYINRLTTAYPNNPLYSTLEFVFYEKIIKEYIIYGTLDFDFYFTQKILNNFVDLAKTLSTKFKNIHYVRLQILYYLNFSDFDEMEKYLIQSLYIYEHNNYKKDLKAKLINFIEIYPISGLTFNNITLLRRYQIFSYLHNFYNSPVDMEIIREYYNFKEIDIKRPSVNRFPLIYQDYLKDFQ